MYVTRPRLLYKVSPDALYEAPPEGPNSGYLVIEQVRGEIKELPLPQNKIIGATYDEGDTTNTSYVLFIPVINQPLSSNHYYMIIGQSNQQGLSCQCTKDEDTEPSCCCMTYTPPRRPRRLNPLDIYQQFKVVTISADAYYPFTVKSVAPDGVVTSNLGGQWKAYLPFSSSKYQVTGLCEEASGLNSALRNSLPSFYFPLSREPPQPVAVGKWVCPFMFIREWGPKEQMKNSTFYEMTLEQGWECVFSCENTDGASSVEVNVSVPTQVVNGKELKEAVVERDEDEGVVWFWRGWSVDDRVWDTKVGISLLIVERMIWEEERVGWVKGEENQVMVSKVETFTQGGNVSSSWKRFGFYVLIERFVLKRADGSLVLTYEFKHTHQTKCIWE